MAEHNAVASTTKSKETSDDSPDGTTPNTFERGPRFWAIIVVLAIISLLTTLEGTVTSTIMPSVVDDLGGGELFIWVSNAYFLTM